MPLSELEEKTERIAAMLDRENVGAVLLNAQHNFAWLTGGSSNGVDMGRDNGVASLLITRHGRRFVLANVIEIERMLLEEVSENDFEPVDYPWQGEKADSGLILEKAKSVLETGVRIASDLPLGASAPVIENRIAACRFQLTTSEIDRYRTLGREAGAAVRDLIDTLRPGETEIEIAEKMRHRLALDGMTSVVTLVAADERISRFRHPVPTANRWEKILMLVTCAKRNGLIASLTRMVCAGEVPNDLEEKTAASAYVNAALLDATRPGATSAELYGTAADAYERHGFGDEINRHHQGGATGYKTREWVAHPHGMETGEINQAFAWNPSITGTKVEETCIANRDGVEIITASPDFPRIVTNINGREYVSPGILSI